MTHYLDSVYQLAIVAAFCSALNLAGIVWVLFRQNSPCPHHPPMPAQQWAPQQAVHYPHPPQHR